MLKVQTYDKKVQIVPIKSAKKISEEDYMRNIRDILRKQIDIADENIGKLEESKIQLYRSKSFDPSLGSPRKYDEERDFLKEKIGICFSFLYDHSVRPIVIYILIVLT